MYPTLHSFEILVHNWCTFCEGVQQTWHYSAENRIQTNDLPVTGTAAEPNELHMTLSSGLEGLVSDMLVGSNNNLANGSYWSCTESWTPTCLIPQIGDMSLADSATVCLTAVIKQLSNIEHSEEVFKEVVRHTLLEAVRRGLRSRTEVGPAPISSSHHFY